MREPTAALIVLFGIAACAEDPVGPVEYSGGFIQVTVGADHSCGLTEDGAAFCWGLGTGGQLGTGDASSRYVPARVSRVLQLAAMSAGFAHTCGVDVNGGVLCWGVNTHGQLGNNSTVSLLIPVEATTTTRFATIASGWLHTCAATSAGAVHCWGSNAQGQVGGAGDERQLTPRLLETPLRFGSLTAGGYHTCGLTGDGSAYCWGGNSLGQLGDGTTLNRSAPSAVLGGHRFVDISAGYTHTCGVTGGGAVFCWGSSVYGELGTAGFAAPGLPGAVQPQSLVTQEEPTFVHVAAGYYVTCAVTREHAAWCWGRGGDGQLGNGSLWNRVTPQPVSDGDITNTLRLRRISVGATHACAVSPQNAALCWGRGESGQLGAGGRAYSPLAIRVQTE